MSSNIFSKLLKNIPSLHKEKQNDDNNSEENKSEDISTLKNMGVAGGTSEIARKHADQAAETFKKLDENLKWKQQRQQLENVIDSNGKNVNVKKLIKEKAFEGKSTIKDRYSDNDLVLKRIDAKIKFGDKNYTKHQAEPDHITSLKKIYNDKKNNAWDSIDDIKGIANADDNFAVINSKLNKSKQEKTNKEYLDWLDEQGRGDEVKPEYRKVMLKDQADSEKFLKKSFRKREIKNVVKTGHKAGVDAAKSSALIGGGISTIQNIVAVVKGEKDAGEAVVDTVKDTAGAAALGYSTGALGSTISHTLSYSSNTMLQTLSKTNLPSQIAVAALETGKTMKKLICGEIDGTECMVELGEKGTGMIAASYGAFAGQVLIPIPVVGGMIGSMVGYAFASSYYNGLVSIMQNRKLAHEERIRIEAECKEALEAIRNYRQEVERIAEEYFTEYMQVFNLAFGTISEALETGDADKVIAGANMITSKLGGQVQYNNMQEFDALMNNEEEDFIL